MSRSRRCGEPSAMNGANGISDIEGKAARVAASECGQGASFNTKRISGMSADGGHAEVRSKN
jgi:hypothetical protein